MEVEAFTFSAVLDIVGRALCIYVFILLGIRIFGKKEIAQLSVIDFVFILLISNAVQNAMIGPYISLWSGLIAASTLFVLNYLLKYLVYNFKKFGKLIEGEPIILVYDGKILAANLKKAKITLMEIQAAIREHELNDVSDVRLAILEVNGNISVIPNQPASNP